MAQKAVSCAARSERRAARAVARASSAGLDKSSAGYRSAMAFAASATLPAAFTASWAASDTARASMTAGVVRVTRSGRDVVPMLGMSFSEEAVYTEGDEQINTSPEGWGNPPDGSTVCRIAWSLRSRHGQASPGPWRCRNRAAMHWWRPSRAGSAASCP